MKIDIDTHTLNIITTDLTATVRDLEKGLAALPSSNYSAGETRRVEAALKNEIFNRVGFLKSVNRWSSST